MSTSWDREKRPQGLHRRARTREDCYLEGQLKNHDSYSNLFFCRPQDQLDPQLDQLDPQELLPTPALIRAIAKLLKKPNPDSFSLSLAHRQGCSLFFSLHLPLPCPSSGGAIKVLVNEPSTSSLLSISFTPNPRGCIPIPSTIHALRAGKGISSS